jgi:hypothetical protein
MKEFPDKVASELTREEISQILSLEKRLKKQALFYKPKNESMPEICFPFYNKDGAEDKAFKDGRIKTLVVCKFVGCDKVLGCPSGSIKSVFKVFILFF